MALPLGGPGSGDAGSRAVALGFVRQDLRQTDRQNVTAMVAALKGLTRP